jgi:hypothetical protein
LITGGLSVLQVARDGKLQLEFQADRIGIGDLLGFREQGLGAGFCGLLDRDFRLDER